MCRVVGGCGGGGWAGGGGGVVVVVVYIRLRRKNPDVRMGVWKTVLNFLIQMCR